MGENRLHPSFKAMQMRASMSVTAMAALIVGVNANTYIYKDKCQGHTCNEAEFPLLDWDPETNKCFCRAHPCHHDSNDAGQRVTHSCNGENPFLGFTYSEDKKLQCACQKTVFAGSVHIAKDLCPGQGCAEGEDYLLDYNAAERKCVCNKHPCTNDNGLAHACTDPKFPILSYHYEEDGKLTCKCNVPYKADKDEL